MAVNKRLLQGAAEAGGLVPSEHFGVVLYEGDGSSSHSINGGKFGAGGYFNGTTSEVTTSNITGLDTTTISISCWVYMHEVGTFNHFVSRFGTGGHSTYQFILRNTSAAKWSLATYDGTGSGDSLTSTATASVNTWYHVAAVIDGTSKKIYVNGSEVASSTVAFSVNTSSGAGLNIGGRDDLGASNSERMNGKIDQVRVFSKALSSSEVTTLYSETASTVESLDPLSEDTTATLQVLGDSSCLAAYQFENDETDLSGNYNGVGTKIQYGAGRYGQAASFNGGSSYVTIPSSTNPLGFINNNFSYSLWINTVSGGEDDIIGNWDTGSSSNNHFLMVYNGKLRMHLKGAGVGDSTASISTNQWYHIVCTTDWTNGQFKYYINGSLDSTKTISTTAHSVSAANNLYIGTRTGVSPNFGGRIDQVRIFNKALSAAEVTTLYNENSLVASYRFEGNAEDDTRNYDGTASNVTYEYGLSFKPDFVWLKSRTSTHGHRVIDSSTGTDKYLETSSTSAQLGAGGAGLISFDTGGFTVGSGNAHNINGNDFVAWCLKVNGGNTSSNTDGSITSTVQVNQNAGFSIVQYTGTGSNSTVGHGLSAAPKVVIIKKTNTTDNWQVSISNITGVQGQRVYLNLGQGISTDVNRETAKPSSTVLSVGGQDCASSTTYISYCFAEVAGFSKFGTYIGNASDNGPIVETGFEPAFVIIKRTDTADNWSMTDNKRSTVNPRDESLFPNLTQTELTAGYSVNYLSNGFQIATSGAGVNASGGTFLYMAFAADPDTVVPTKAKSFTSVAYTGTGTNQKVEGLGFAPNLVWIKSRSTTNPHVLHDTVRGIGNVLFSNLTNAEADESAYFTSVGYDYLQFGTNAGNYNNTGTNYIAWAWKADDNEPTINTDGSIDSLVSANANAGFSIVKYEGNGIAGATIGHGLSATPEFLIVKCISGTDSGSTSWHVYTPTTGATKTINLNSTAAASTNSLIWNDTAPTSTVFSVANNTETNNTGRTYIAYCFHSVSGYSKIGSWTGTGTTGNSVNVGFRPDFILWKRTDASVQWIITDSVRSSADEFSERLDPGSSGAEAGPDGYTVTITDTGFEMSGSFASWTGSNASGGTYIYAAFKIN